jgi:hypothetical protein
MEVISFTNTSHEPSIIENLIFELIWRSIIIIK